MRMLILFFFPALAFAQSSGSINMDSLRAPFSVKATYSLTLQTESIGSTTGKLAANPGQVAKVGAVDLIKQMFVLAEIPGPKTAGSKTLVASVKATWTVAGGMGWFADPIVIHAVRAMDPAQPLGFVPLNIEVPAGMTLAIRYDMPAVAGTSLAPGTFSWLVGVGAKATDIPAPVAGPTAGGTVTPPPPPAPPPAPATVFSSIADGATLAGSIAWTATAVGVPATVEFLIDGISKWTERSAPYQFNGDPAGLLDTRTLANGAHALKVLVTYPDGTIGVAVLNVTVAN